MVICEEQRIPNCVIVSPHSPFLPEAFGVWEGKKLKGSMERFQAPDVTLTLRVSTDLAEAIVDVAGRMELPIGRLNKDWELDRGVTVPSIFLLRADETKRRPRRDLDARLGRALALRHGDRQGGRPARRGRRDRRVVQPLAPHHAGRTPRLLAARGPSSTASSARRSTADSSATSSTSRRTSAAKRRSAGSRRCSSSAARSTART